MKTRQTKLNISMIVLLAITTAVLNACGGTAYRETSPTPEDQGSQGPKPAPQPSEEPKDKYVPTVTHSFTITGEGGEKTSYTTPTIQTDNRLRVKVIGGTAQNLTLPSNESGDEQYSGFTANYGCVSFTVTVAGQSVQTDVLQVGDGTAYSNNCPNAKKEQIIDFSGRLGPGHGPVTIEVTSARYDFYCNLCRGNPQYYYLMGGNCNLYCPLKPAYKTHTLSGSLEVEINGSSY